MNKSSHINHLQRKIFTFKIEIIEQFLKKEKKNKYSEREASYHISKNQLHQKNEIH